MLVYYIVDLAITCISILSDNQLAILCISGEWAETYFKMWGDKADMAMATDT